MTRETRRNVGELLASQLDAIEADLTARARPYTEAAELRRQRDSARSWAVDYEQTAAEMTRRVSIACLIVDEMPCDCRWVANEMPMLTFATEVANATLRECAKHQLDRVLRGDE